MAELRDHIRDPRHAVAGSAAPADLTQLHDQFVTEQRFSVRLSPRTLLGYENSFRLLVALMPTLTLGQLTPTVMTEFFRRLETRPRQLRNGNTKAGVRTSTVATYRSKLNRFFTWLAAKGHLRANPFETMPYPHVTYEDRKYLSRTAVERIFAALVLTPLWRTRFLRKRNVALFAVLLYAGVRKGELLALRITDLDLDRLEITIRAETSKSKMRRVVPINSRLYCALEDYLTQREQHGCQSEYLFTSATADRPLSADGLKHLVAQVVRRSGVRFHVHQFRHTFAVNVLGHGGDVAKLKQLLGHRDIRMTSTYLRCLPTSAMRTDVEGITLDTLL